MVVCAGAKAILDIPATLEVLESYGVPVIGYQTDEFPAFYSSSSGLPVSARVDTPEEVARLAKTHWGLELPRLQFWLWCHLHRSCVGFRLR